MEIANKQVLRYAKDLNRVFFDALTSERPYKKAYSLEVARDIIWKERGNHFDPRIVDVFFDNLDEFRK